MAFSTRSSIPLFVSLIVIPRSLVLLTTCSSFSSTTTAWNSWSYKQTKSWALYIFPDLGSSQVFLCNQVILWALLTSPLWMISKAVVSSTNFHQKGEWIVRSFIIRINNHGPNLLPCGTPDGTEPHSAKQPLANFILCELFDKKSIIQLTMLQGMSRLHNLVINVLWSM